MTKHRLTRGRGLAALVLIFGLALSASGCRKKHRYDGTCSEDAHCLDFQRCKSGVCVRKQPIIDEKPLKVARPEAPSRARMKPDWQPDRTADQQPSVDVGDKPGAAEPAKPAAPMRTFTPNRPRPAGRAQAAFRIDA